MIGARLGPWRLVAPIGTGGMGAVYRAVAEDGAPVPAGTAVAVKVIHPQLADDPAHVSRFLREAELGRRIAHENLVRTLDAGEAEAEGRRVRWLAMDLVEGRTLRRLAEDLGRVPEALLREIALQAARALAAVHAAGVVHRDVKPENVVVTPDHRVRLMDLGIARLLEGGSALTRTGSIAGSLLYVAPEQVRGEELTPAADLYALGMTLYELAAGKHPFAGLAVPALLDAQWKRTPERLDRVDRALSPFFASLVEALVEKPPERRPRGAAEVVEILTEGETGAWWRARAARAPAPDPVPQVPVARDAPLVGREGALKAFEHALEEARGGAGRVVLLEGEPGIGKTRVLAAFAERVAGPGARVLYGAIGDDGSRGALGDALVRLLGADGLEHALERLGFAPPLAASFAAWLRRGTPPPGVEPLSRDAAQAAYVRALGALSADRPVVAIVDDLHRGGAEALAVLQGIARAIGATRALVLAAARPGLPAEGVAALEATGVLRRVGLPRLGAEGVRDLLRAALGSRAVADRLASDVAARSDGVPLFALEIARQLRESGAVRVGTDGARTTVDLSRVLEVPRVVRDVVLARLRDLRREERDLLDAAAVQGVEFEADLAARAIDARRVRVLQDLADLERRTGLVRAAGRLFRFDHHQVRATLLEELPEALREEYHALTAEAVAERVGAGPDADAAAAAAVPIETAVALVRHGVLGARPRLARPFVDRVLTHLDAAGRPGDALEIARRALDVPGLLDDAQRQHALLAVARALELLGRRDGIDEALQEAVALSDRGGDPVARSRARAMWGRSLWVRGRFPEATAPLEQALALAREAGDAAAEGFALRGLGLLATNTGRLDDAETYGLAHLEIARRLGDATGEAMALGNLGIVAENRGERELARERYEACRALAERAGARRTVCTTVGNLALVDLAEGRFAAAEAGFQRYLALAHEVAERTQAAYAHVNLGLLLHQMGAEEEARASLESCLVECEATGQRRVESYARERLGAVAEALGDLATARASHEAALAVRREIRYPSGVAASLVALASLDVREGHVDAARPRLEAALSVCAEHGLRAVAVEALLVQVAASRGEDAEAVAAAVAAFEADGHLLDAHGRLETLGRLWVLTRRDAYWAEALSISDRILADAPPARRAGIAARVEAHRVVRGA